MNSCDVCQKRKNIQLTPSSIISSWKNRKKRMKKKFLILIYKKKFLVYFQFSVALTVCHSHSYSLVICQMLKWQSNPFLIYLTRKIYIFFDESCLDLISFMKNERNILLGMSQIGCLWFVKSPFLSLVIALYFVSHDSNILRR